MPDVHCPYCGKGQEICHDDGFGCDENQIYQQECDCGKTFVFTTEIVITHYVSKAPCCNGEQEHQFERTKRGIRVMNGFEELRCKRCHHTIYTKSKCYAACKKVKQLECYKCDLNK